MTVPRQVRQRQDRSKRSGHAHSLNTQDLPGLHLTRQQRAVWKFVQVAALLPQEDGYYEDLPPAARMAVDAVREVARQLEPSIKPTKGKGHD